MSPIPRPLDPPRHGPYSELLPLCSGLSPQIGGLIASAHILQVCKGLAAVHHCQFDALAIAKHLGHGAAISVDGLGPKRHQRTAWGQLLQAVP